MSLFTRERRNLDSASVWGDDYVTPLGVAGVTRLAPVYGAVSLISDLFSMVPAHTVTELDTGEFEPLRNPPIVRDPNPDLSRSAWRTQYVLSMKLRGNAYGLTDPGRRYCWWMHPDWVSIDETNPMRPVYYVNGQPMETVRRGGNLVHIREFVHPGSVKGVSPIQHFADTFERANLASAYGRKWFRNASVPPAILSTTEKRLGADKLREARDDFIAATAEGKPVALPGEWTWSKISINPQEAQFLETIEATATEIATIFRVAPEDIGGKAGNSRTYSNREQDAELLNIRTLMPVGNRLAEAYEDLLPSGQTVQFDYDVLAQPGQLESARADSEELRNGTLRLEEARRRRGRRPLTEQEIADWQAWYQTNKSESESLAESVSESITREA